MDQPLDLDLEGWDAWSPGEAARHLEGLSTPWYVSAGWALDLFLGRKTRPHADLEIGVPARSFAEVQEALAGFEIVVIGDGAAWPVTETTLAGSHQTWVREPGGPWRVDVFREPWDDDGWIFRRDPRIRLPAASAVSPHRRRHRVSATGDRLALQGEGSARQGRDGLRNGPPPPGRRSPPVVTGRADCRAPRSPLDRVVAG